MSRIEQNVKWLKDIFEEQPESFSSYFLFDIELYMNLDEIDISSINGILGIKYDSFLNCKTKDEVRDWLNAITSFIVMKLPVDDIIADYFGN